jgi:hypothetical protein
MAISTSELAQDYLDEKYIDDNQKTHLLMLAERLQGKKYADYFRSCVAMWLMNVIPKVDYENANNSEKQELDSLYWMFECIKSIAVDEKTPLPTYPDQHDLIS